MLIFLPSLNDTTYLSQRSFGTLVPSSGKLAGLKYSNSEDGEQEIGSRPLRKNPQEIVNKLI